MLSEDEQLSIVRALAVTDPSPDPESDELIRYVARACNAPIAVLALVGRSRLWFKARLGLDVAEAPKFPLPRPRSPRGLAAAETSELRRRRARAARPRGDRGRGRRSSRRRQSAPRAGAWRELPRGRAPPRGKEPGRRGGHPGWQAAHAFDPPGRHAAFRRRPGAGVAQAAAPGAAARGAAGILAGPVLRLRRPRPVHLR